MVMLRFCMGDNICNKVKGVKQAHANYEVSRGNVSVFGKKKATSQKKWPQRDLMKSGFSVEQCRFRWCRVGLLSRLPTVRCWPMLRRFVQGLYQCRQQTGQSRLCWLLIPCGCF